MSAMLFLMWCMSVPKFKLSQFALVMQSLNIHRTYYSNDNCETQLLKCVNIVAGGHPTSSESKPCLNSHL